MDGPSAGGSHPDFSVGGHMTPNKDGSVPIGGVCYLMPLCYWHNSKSRDDTPFTLSKQRILRLSGYSLGELSATFTLRLPDKRPYAAVYFDGDGWAHANLTEADVFSIARGDHDLDIKPGSKSLQLFKRDQLTQRLYSIELPPFVKGKP
ncbi:MAG: hypothetical protein AAFN13_02165 [Bacteroidota bacterium]